MGHSLSNSCLAAFVRDTISCLVCLLAFVVHTGWSPQLDDRRCLPEEAKEFQCGGIWVKLIDWTRSLSEWTSADGAKVTGPIGANRVTDNCSVER